MIISTIHPFKIILNIHTHRKSLRGEILPNVSYVLMQYDTDGSGQIEFPEFCNMMSHKMNASDDKEAVINWRRG